ncbi:MAG: hypothetical protein IPJ69_05685 [Deltaproteobacteria bacterium]|nr:MAG: hypothetical protein IPJ69_05685 [Deltaproteobacteria bacterium]
MSILGRITAFATPLFNFEKPITPTSLPAPANQSPTRSGAIATATLAVLVSGCSLNHTAVSWDDGMDATADISNDARETGKDTGDGDDVSDAGTDTPDTSIDVTADHSDDVNIEAAVDVTDEGIDNDVSDAGIDTPDTSIDLPDSGPVTDIPTDTPPDTISDGGIIDVPTDIPSDTSDASVPDSGIDVPTVDISDVTPDFPDTSISDAGTTDVSTPSDVLVDAGRIFQRPSGTVFLPFTGETTSEVSNHATLAPTPFGTLIGNRVRGIYGNAVSLLSAGNGVVAADSAIGALGGGPFLVGGSFQFETSSSGLRTLVGKAGTGGWFFRVTPTGSLSFGTVGGACNISGTSPIPADGAIHDYYAQRGSDNNVTLYVIDDGGLRPLSTPIACSASLSGASPLTFGASNNSGTLSLFLNGVLDNGFVGIGPEIATSVAIQTLYCSNRQTEGLGLPSFCVTLP